MTQTQKLQEAYTLLNEVFYNSKKEDIRGYLNDNPEQPKTTLGIVHKKLIEADLNKRNIELKEIFEEKIKAKMAFYDLSLYNFRAKEQLKEHVKMVPLDGSLFEKSNTIDTLNEKYDLNLSIDDFNTSINETSIQTPQESKLSDLQSAIIELTGDSSFKFLTDAEIWDYVNIEISKGDTLLKSKIETLMRVNKISENSIKNLKSGNTKIVKEISTLYNKKDNQLFESDNTNMSNTKPKTKKLSLTEINKIEDYLTGNIISDEVFIQETELYAKHLLQLNLIEKLNLGPCYDKSPEDIALAYAMLPENDFKSEKEFLLNQINEQKRPDTSITFNPKLKTLKNTEIQKFKNYFLIVKSLGSGKYEFRAVSPEYLKGLNEK